MAKIRAYKLAAELGIDRHDFVERAAEVGMELKSAMASLDDEQVKVLRQKLGKPVASGRLMEESRVESKRGTTVLRRRKKAAVEEPALVEETAVAPAPVAGEEAGEPALDEIQPKPSDEEVPGKAAPEPEGDEAAELPRPLEPLGPTSGEGTTGAPERRVAAKPASESGAAANDRKGKQRKRVREVVNLQEQERFARQITGRGHAGRRVPAPAPRAAVNPRRKRRDKLSLPAVTKPAAELKKAIKVEGEISVGELARLLGVKAPLIQGKLMALGTMVSINQTVDIETSRQVAAEFDFEVQDTGFKEEQFLEPGVEQATEAGEGGERHHRAPIITVMGHVDHGKTSLLDAIRNVGTNVVDTEFGGITQHIGAYQVTKDGKQISFIDTPGHAAFTAMRARGAAATDVVVLVVAANDGVMPQTVEAIEHAQAAGCPIVVAINKVDLSDADPEKTKQRLTEHNLVPEDFGGDVICCNVSAKTGEGIDHLLEMLIIQSEVLELKADPSRRAKGVVLEARLDKGRGPMATLLVQDGTLNTGDVIVVGTESGRVRVMENDRGDRIKEAGPSVPVQVQGLSGVPTAGARFHAVESDRVAKQITAHREDQARSRPSAAPPRLTLEEFFAQAEGAGPKELSVVLKADVQGTCEAARDSLEKLSTDEVKLKILSAGVGAINENDVMLATASEAIVIGFHVRPDAAARRAAESAGVDLRTYTIIMDLLDQVKAAMAGLLPPVRKESMLGRAEVRQIFTIPKIGTIAGSLIVEGKAVRGAHCRLVRDGVQVYEGRMSSLRRFKDDVKEVPSGTECGIGIENYSDIKVGDEIEVFDVEELPATL
ncbi:MAG: translation initiation factor IF-2 [Deltaproteobacteria bacterium]|nr:translation initiation factor IF-2 [Deltaproteobacteria bacterium]